MSQSQQLTDASTSFGTLGSSQPFGSSTSSTHSFGISSQNVNSSVGSTPGSDPTFGNPSFGVTSSCGSYSTSPSRAAFGSYGSLTSVHNPFGSPGAPHSRTHSGSFGSSNHSRTFASWNSQSHQHQGSPSVRDSSPSSSPPSSHFQSNQAQSAAQSPNPFRSGSSSSRANHGHMSRNGLSPFQQPLQPSSNFFAGQPNPPSSHHSSFTRNGGHFPNSSTFVSNSLSSPASSDSETGGFYNRTLESGNPRRAYLLAHVTDVCSAEFSPQMMQRCARWKLKDSIYDGDTTIVEACTDGMLPRDLCYRFVFTFTAPRSLECHAVFQQGREAWNLIRSKSSFDPCLLKMCMSRALAGGEGEDDGNDGDVESGVEAADGDTESGFETSDGEESRFCRVCRAKRDSTKTKIIQLTSKNAAMEGKCEELKQRNHDLKRQLKHLQGEDLEKLSGKELSELFDQVKHALSRVTTEKNNRSSCVICMEEAHDNMIVFLPCRHQKVCKNCSEKIFKCPLCNADIAQKISTYK